MYYEIALELKKNLSPRVKKFNAVVGAYDLSEDEAEIRVIGDGLVLNYTISEMPNMYFFDRKTEEIIFDQDGTYSADDLFIWFNFYWHGTERNLK